jgi:hypothetical protein
MDEILFFLFSKKMKKDDIISKTQTKGNATNQKKISKILLF